MKISILVALTILLNAVDAKAQQNPNLDFKYSVKLSNLSTLQKRSEVNRVGNNDTAIIDEHNSLRLFHPTIAFQIKNKRNNIHEIELTDLSVARVSNKHLLSYRPDLEPFAVGGYSTTSTNVALRYEYIRTFSRKINSRFMPSLGFGILPYYQRDSYKPILSTDYIAKRTVLGAKGFLIPRVCYNVSKRLFVDLNIPMCFVDVNAKINKLNNPNLPFSEQRNTITNAEMFPDFFSLRLGLGLRI